MNIRKNTGITLIALVVTIVLLIILAGVSINMVVGDEGIFNIAKKQQEQMKILQITERLELEKANMAIDNLGVINLDKYIENIQKKGNKVGEYEVTSIERIEQGKATIVVDGKYQYIIEEENNGNIKITYETDIKNAKPVIKEIEIIEVTTSSAKLKVKALNVNKYEIYINGSKEPKPQIEEIKGKEEIIITYNNLEQQRDYTIKVEAINKNGVVEKEKTIKTIEMVDLGVAEVIYTKTNTNWTNQNVTTTISFNTDKNIEGYKIEYIKFGIYEEVTSEKLSKGTWLQYTTSGITSTQNEKIYTRLNDGYNTTSYTSTEIRNIDKEKPTIEEVTQTTNSITIKAKDEISGIIGYVLTNNNVKPTEFTSCANTKNLNVTIPELNQNTTYYVWVKDEAGNINEEKSIITGKQPVTNVVLNKTKIGIGIGENQTITEKIEPDNAYNKKVTWMSSNSSIAKVENGVVTGVSIGNATITATAQDGSGKSASLEVVVGLSASNIASNPTAYYGKEVSNYTSRVVNGKDYNNAVQNWRIFHADNENIYLIADRNVNYNYVPNSKNYSIYVNDDYYDLSFDNVYKDYIGSEDIIGTKPAKWLNIFLNSYPTSKNPNIRSVAYMLDTNIWSVYAGDKAEYAIGGPTLEMFCASYKNTHSSKYVECDLVNEYGYYVKWNTDSSYVSNYLHGIIEGEYSNIYYSYTWLASPSCESDEYCISHFSGRYLSSQDLNNSGNGLRPVVCLKSDVLLKPNSSGNYDILGSSENELIGNFNATNLAIGNTGGGWPGGYADGTKVVLPAGINGIQFGPYINLKSGYYYIEYIGTNLNDEKLNYVSSYNNGQKPNTIMNLTKTNNKVSYNIYLPNDVSGFEMAVYAPSPTANIVIDSVKIYKETYNSAN